MSKSCLQSLQIILLLENERLRECNIYRNWMCHQIKKIWTMMMTQWQIPIRIRSATTIPKRTSKTNRTQTRWRKDCPRKNSHQTRKHNDTYPWRETIREECWQKLISEYILNHIVECTNVQSRKITNNGGDFGKRGNHIERN